MKLEPYTPLNLDAVTIATGGLSVEGIYSRARRDTLPTVDKWTLNLDRETGKAAVLSLKSEEDACYRGWTLLQAGLIHLQDYVAHAFGLSLAGGKFIAELSAPVIRSRWDELLRSDPNDNICAGFIISHTGMTKYREPVVGSFSEVLTELPDDHCGGVIVVNLSAWFADFIDQLRDHEWQTASVDTEAQ